MWTLNIKQLSFKIKTVLYKQLKQLKKFCFIASTFVPLIMSPRKCAPSKVNMTLLPLVNEYFEIDCRWLTALDYKLFNLINCEMFSFSLFIFCFIKASYFRIRAIFKKRYIDRKFMRSITCIFKLLKWKTVLLLIYF